MRKSMILSGVLFSGLIFGATTAPAIVNAATEQTAETSTKDDTDVTANISYYDATGKLVGTESVTGAVGSTQSLKSIPAGYALQNSAEKTITLVNANDAKTYEQTVFVNKVVTNNVIFKTSDQAEVGRTTVSSEKVGDKVDLSDEQIPSGYAITDKSVTIQTDGNTQIVTVTKVDPISSFKGVVTVGKNSASLYKVDGSEIKTRALGPDSSWSVDKKLVLNGVTYYRVATSEWVNGADVTVTGGDTDTNTDTDTSTDTNTNTDTNTDTTLPDGIVKSDKSAVTTLSVESTTLYKADGTIIKNRGLGSNSSWLTTKMATINGEKMYKVATNEWVAAKDIK